MPCINYTDKEYHGERLALIEKINDVIADYSAQGYSLTLRQVYYQMVARAIIPNNERSYKNLGNLINGARLAGYVDWSAIEDRTRNLRSLSHWSSPGGIIKSAAYSYHRNLWAYQPHHVEVWVEKDALVGIVGKACDALDVSYFSCRGYVSQSEMWSAAQRLIQHQQQGKEIVLLHLGDHDPSGKDMSRDIVDRLRLFEVDMSSLDFRRLALNMDQIEQYGPPPNPTKLTDSRASGYIDEFGYECWELDALEPKVIERLIRENVEECRDDELYYDARDQERRERRELDQIAENWDEVVELWKETE